MKINKNLLVCGIIFIVSSIIALLIFVLVNLCKMNRDEIYVDNNLDVYTENQLSKYDGGFLAEKFFPEYIELGEYKKWEDK